METGSRGGDLRCPLLPVHGTGAEPYLPAHVPSLQRGNDGEPSAARGWRRYRVVE